MECKALRSHGLKPTGTDLLDWGRLRRATRKALSACHSKPERARFFGNLESELLSIRSDINGGGFQPGKLMRFTIHDPKRREICAPPLRDRVVHHLLIGLLEPIFERRFISHSYACRKEKGSHAALQTLKKWAKSHKSGWYFKADIADYFGSINHTILLNMLGRVVKDPMLFDLCRVIIQNTEPVGAKPSKGLPIGSLTSQWFANLYLDRFDHFSTEVLGWRRYLRYMDDFVVICLNEEEARKRHDEAQRELESRLDLRLNSKVVRCASLQDGIPFLGHRVFRGIMRLQRRSLVRSFSQLHHNMKRLAIEENCIRPTQLGEVSIPMCSSPTIDSFRSIWAHLSAVADSHNLRHSISNEDWMRIDESCPTRLDCIGGWDKVWKGTI